MNIIEKIYFCEYCDEMDKVIELLSMPAFAMCCETETVEMNYIKLTILCLENQLCGIEHILEEYI